MTDTKRLEDLIKKMGYKKLFVAKMLGLTPYGLQKKICNETEFKAGEIKKLCDLLGISSLEEKEKIFFRCE